MDARSPSHVVTLVASADAADAMPDVAAALAAELAVKDGPDWLAPALACDMRFHCDPTTAELTARRVIGETAIDVLIQPAAGRRKMLLAADLESTIIENEMLDELADFVGARAQVAEITRRAMNGELDFVAALQERVGLLRGLPTSVLEEAAGRIRLMPGARTLIATCRTAGVRTVLVSGGFTVFAERVAAELGFGRVVANRLEIVDGHIAGRVAAPIITRETKRDTLIALAAECRVPLSATLAIGDGANDLPMLETAGLGIAFHAKPAVAAAARWRIDHADLTGVLYAQGYRQADFAG